MTGQTLGHYQVLEKLGAGGMGEVYRARDTRLGRDVAIKVLPPLFAQDHERLARFQREAQLLAALNHPNIAAIYGLEESGGQPYLVLEYVPGETLRGPLSVEDALPIARQIIDALEEAHERGIIHRDLKPANVKITPEGKVKVLDFGLAKALSDDPDSTVASQSPTLTAAAVTRGGVLLGTAAYMSPEQARGKRVDKRADIWAFGCVLYEMLTGRQIFGGETISDSLAAILKNEPDWKLLPDTTPWNLRRLLERCLEKDVQRRLRDIGEARIILETSEPQITTKTPSHQERPWFSLVAWCLGGGIAVFAAALAFIHFRETPPETPVSRFEIRAPEKSTFNFAPVISPDGRRLAVQVTGPDGRQLLWVRTLESLEARSLPGTDGALLPFWSPDGRFVAFWSPGKLKKIEATGGPPQALCDVKDLVLGGSWNRDGMIIFGSLVGGLQRVSAAGGVPAPLTTLDLSRREFAHVWPQFLPDGRHFLYFAWTNQPENAAMYLSSLDSPKVRKRLLATDFNAAYAPPHNGGPGHLLFLREGTLMAQPFDAQRLELSGEAFPVAERVGTFRSTAFFSVSANGVLAYRGGAGLNSQLAWFDRAGKQLQAVGPPGDYQDLALSPDGARVAVSRGELQGRNFDLWLIEIERNISSRFTFHPARDWLPAWSPDGARIVFSSDRDGLIRLYQKLSSGAGNEELLLKSALPQFAGDWAPDGRSIVYSSVSPQTKFDLWVLPLAGDRQAAPYVQTEFNEMQGQFSPDGKFLAYTSDESGISEIYVRPFPGTPSGLSAKWMVSSGGGFQPRWSRNGKEIFYLSLDAKLMALEVKTAPRFEASVPQPLFQTSIFNTPTSIGYRYAPSGDGRRFLMNSVPEETTSAPITLVLNFTAGAKR